MFMDFAEKQYSYLSKSEVVLVFFFAGGGEENYVVDALDELQLHHTLDEQARELSALFASRARLEKKVIWSEVQQFFYPKVYKIMSR